jgi:polysaccharide pyruvyl transferase
MVNAASPDKASVRVLHPCLPNYDNLGDTVANEAIRPIFRRRGVELELIAKDIWDGHLLDDQIDEINDCFDMIMIGPGGFLGPKLIGSIFRDVGAWSRLSVPLCLNGIGIVASVNRPVWYSTIGENSHIAGALRQASVVSVRELNTWLLAARLMGAHTGRLMLAGCPSVRVVRCHPPVPKTHSLALNLSFMHEVCRQYVPALRSVAEAVRAQFGRVLWICHSRRDADQAEGVNRQLGLGFDIMRPCNAAEAGAAYAACELALVTRFHAGMFCLANAVPFAFLGYDMKCWHLMTMIADEPYQYVLPLERLGEMDIPAEITRLRMRLEANAGHLRIAERLLIQYFDEQTDQFVDAAIAASGFAPNYTANEVPGEHPA